MRRLGRRAVVPAVVGAILIALVLTAALRTNAPGGGDVAIVVQKASLDSEAPVTAPAHWLPPEDWVYNHWLPFDEARLHQLLGVTRGAIWRRLRNDRNNLAQLAARRGWPDPGRLAAALVATRSHDVTPRTLALLRSRAKRTLTQGHLAQHLLFHSLHQFAIPSAAPEIFGVTDAVFRQLRRSEQSPLEIGRLNGRSPARIEALSAAVLRERLRFGTETGAMSERQGRLLLRRQISQLPRWLAQVRYNGPPPTHLGKLTGKPRDYAANPALSGDGDRVVYEAYLQKLPLALRKGEISVLSAAPGGGATKHVSFDDSRRTPRSAYNATVSGDGRRVAFESAEGNLNFAKRYGQIHVFVKDVRSGRTRKLSLPPARDGVSRSEYNPAISANGRRIAYQAQRRGGQSAVYVTDLRSGHATLASRATSSAAGADRGVYDPAISGDGTKVAFTTAAANLGAGDLEGQTQVFVRDLTARTTTLVSRASGARGAIADGYSADPAISHDGRWVAFASAGGNLAGRARGGGSRIYVRDLRSGRTRAVSGPREFALKPSISADGRAVAYTSMARSRSQVLVRDVRRAGPARVVSRVSGMSGALGDGASADAVISADGRRVAFTSAATNLSPGKADNRRGVFVRDLRTHATTLVSAPAPKQAATPVAISLTEAATRRAPLASAARPTATVSVRDNAFFRRGDRPTVRLRAGGVLTWRWAAQQSHQVTVRVGPQQFETRPQAAGAYSARLRRRGTYQLVCAIHAPGMRMTVVVE